MVDVGKVDLAENQKFVFQDRLWDFRGNVFITTFTGCLYHKINLKTFFF